MPFPRTWTEELVAEWLHLEGYLVEANMPVMVARAGGRLEADVVGAKISKRTLDIKHVEVGAPAGGRGSIRKLVGKKFSSKMEKAIRSYFKRKFRPVGKVAYRKMYVATYSTEPVRDEFRRLGIEVVQLQDFLAQTVLPTIKRWKENPPFHPKHGGESVQLPESHWLLSLLEHLNSWGMIRAD